MNCCETIRPTWGDIEPASVVSNTRASRSTRVMAYLKALMTPEPSDTGELVLELPPGRLFGAVKAVLWALVAVGLGIVLALGCN